MSVARIKVRLDGTVYDLTQAVDRFHVLRWVASQVKHKHGPMHCDAMHPVQLDPQALRLRVIPHRFGGGAIRLDGFCLHPDCMGEHGQGEAFVHQEQLLTWNGDNYIGDSEIGKLRPGLKRLLPDGHRYVDAKGLQRLVEAIIAVAAR